jgi:hypothetical protein
MEDKCREDKEHMEKSDADRTWERFLNPVELRSGLIFSAVYIACYELLEDRIVDRIKSFFTFGRENDSVSAEIYQKEIMSDSKTVLMGSLEWLMNNEVIDKEDKKTFLKVREVRNKIAHNLLKRITEEDYTVYWQNLKEIGYLIDKIEKWWIVNYAIPINPDFDNVEVDEDSINSGTGLMLAVLFDVAFGDDSKAWIHYNNLFK